MEANDFVMNTKTAKAYRITTDTVQTRGRRQLVGTGIRNPELTQVTESHLTLLNDAAAYVCFEAEKIIRGKHKLTDHDRQVLAMHKALKNIVVA